MGGTATGRTIERAILIVNEGANPFFLVSFLIKMIFESSES